MARSTVFRRGYVAFRQFRRFLVLRVLHADDPPRRLALGAAAGLCVAFTPTVGVQMVAAAALAWVMRGNKAVAVAMVWITNPLTIVPIYYPCYWLGAHLTGYEMVHISWWEELVDPPTAGWWDTVAYMWGHFMEVAVPLWVGCVFVALILATVGYFVTYHVVCAYRMRRWGRLIPPVIGTAHRLRRLRHDTGDTT